VTVTAVRDLTKASYILQLPGPDNIQESHLYYPMAESGSSSSSGNSNNTEKIDVGASAWVPATATQLMFTPPPEYNVNASSSRLAYLPTTLRSVDESGMGSFVLEWSSAVVVKCKVSLQSPSAVLQS
jgi:hypothetical protein